jgi:hypothetical protein
MSKKAFFLCSDFVEDIRIDDALDNEWPPWHESQLYLESVVRWAEVSSLVTSTDASSSSEVVIPVRQQGARYTSMACFWKVQPLVTLMLNPV